MYCLSSSVYILLHFLQFAGSIIHLVATTDVHTAVLDELGCRRRRVLDAGLMFELREPIVSYWFSKAADQKIAHVSRYATRVETVTQIRPGIMNEWLSRYLPMTVVPERSKLTVAISDG